MTQASPQQGFADQRCSTCRRPVIYVEHIGWICNNPECDAKGIQAG